MIFNKAYDYWQTLLLVPPKSRERKQKKKQMWRKENEEIKHHSKIKEKRVKGIKT